MPSRTKRLDEASAPQHTSLEALAESIHRCRACPLWERATQAVPGEGARHAHVMLVGEQPGDQEDRAGTPFVGPAGKVLDRALEEAGIERPDVYVTNAVKHFSWVPRGTRRLHKTPTEREVAACLDWLEQEIRILRPRLIVCMGATAAKALFGPDVRVLRDRGRFLPSVLADHVLVTVHPSSILRGDPADREQAFAEFVRDLRRVHDVA